MTLMGLLILLLIAASGGLLGLPLALLTISWFFKYGFALLDHVADGVIEPPVLSYEMVNPVNESRPLGLLLVVFAYAALTEIVGYSLGAQVTAALRALGLLLLPAIIMTQAAGGFWQSLNPIVLLQIVVRVPGSYALILVVLAGFWWLASRLVGWLPAAELPFAVHIPLPESVRALARHLGLGEVAELPASPCLSSRVETGIAIDPLVLDSIRHAVWK